MTLRNPSGAPQPQGWGDDPLSHWTTVFLRFLQGVFNSFEKGNYKWEDDPLNTDIVIQDQATLQREVVEKRPAIIVAHGPASFSNIALDQFAGPTQDGNGNYLPNEDPRIGQRRYTDLVSASMTYNCISREGVEAARIAWMALFATRALKRTLMHAGLHRVGEDLRVGAESSPGSIVQPDASEIVMVSVFVPFYYQETWTVEPVDKLLLNHVDLALRSELRYPAPGAMPIVRDPATGDILQYDKIIVLEQGAAVGPYKTPKPRKK